MTDRTKYALKDLLKQCDPDAPMPQVVLDWENMEPVGQEKFEDALFQDQLSKCSHHQPKQ